MRRQIDPNTQTDSLRRRVLSLPTLLSFGIATAFILFLATGVDLDWGETWDNIRSMDPWLYAVAAVLYYISFIFRGARWRILAINAAARRNDARRDDGDVRVPSTVGMSQLILIGWFVNSITWLRLGDAYRAHAFAEDSNSSFSWSLGTVLAERVLDMVAVAVIMAVSVAAVALTIGFSGSKYILIVPPIMVVGAIALVGLMVKFGARLAKLLPSRIEAAYHRFHDGTIGSFEQLPAVMALGIVGWLLEIGRLHFVLQALGIDIGLPLTAVVALGHAILSTVPTPGGVGAVEPGVTGLLLIKLSRPDAVAAAILDRSITYVSVIAVGGLVFLLRQVMQMRRAKRQRPQVEAASS